MDLKENSKLLETNSFKNENWIWILLKKYYKEILFCVFLIIIVYVVNIYIGKAYTPLSINGGIEFPEKNPLHISSFATTNNDFIEQCVSKITCDTHVKYRSINGSCNNMQIPTWGASQTPFFRMFNANYSDGFYKMRVQTNGMDLPLVREVNVQVFLNREKYHVDENNVLLMPFAQLIAHDITGVSVDNLFLPNGEILSCCYDKVVIETYPQCKARIVTPPDDPVYRKIGVRCQDAFRFKTSRNYSCPLSPTTFINDKTAFIDASEVYGSTDSVALRLRSMEGGKLNVSTNSYGQTFCPYNYINKRPDVNFQYDAGDPGSVNQNLGITAISTLFLRFHNYIADRLSIINPSWSDETLYQESRRIIIGTIQRVTYEDFLPIIIGSDFQELYGLNKENIYDPTVNPSTSQELASAALRTLHTIIPVQLKFMNNDYKTESAMNITDWMSDPGLLPLDNHFNELIKGLLETSGRVPQHSYNFFVSNFMFHVPYKSFVSSMPFDLMSIDIMAGRDVGLQPYNQIRHLCGLPMAKDFDDLIDLLHIKDIAILKNLYNSVDDIDLIVGLILEKFSDGAIIGPTTRCLIADNFYRIKVGDRFFYDVQGQPGSFTAEQLKTIKEITLGHVICASSDVNYVQKDIFKMVDHNLFPTSKLRCDQSFLIDLSAWKQSDDQQEL